MAQHGLYAIELMILYITMQHASNERYQVKTDGIYVPYTKLYLAYLGQVTVWRVLQLDNEEAKSLLANVLTLDLS